MSGTHRLLDQLRERIRVKHYSIRTDETYLHWVKRYILFYNKRHPAGMGAPQGEAFCPIWITDLFHPCRTHC
jgi:hypothetical protein